MILLQHIIFLKRKPYSNYKTFKKHICAKNHSNNSLTDSVLEIINESRVKKYMPIVIIIGTRNTTKNILHF